MTTAASRFRRVTLMLPTFAEQPTQLLSQLSAHLGVPPATIVADLKTLIERFEDLAGFEEPLSVSIEGDRVSLTTDHFLRPMRVSMAELCALELGLAVLARRESHALMQATLAKLQRCIASLPQDHRWRTLRGTALHESGGAALDALRGAIRRRRVVEFDYQRPNDAASGGRTVRPYGILFSRGSWYLAGWCERADAQRLFRVDRIGEVTITDREHAIPPDFNADALLVDGRAWSGGPAGSMRVRYSAAIARWIAERDGQPVEPDGSAIREHPLGDREWAIRHVLQYGPDAQVLEPTDLREEIVERLETMT